MSLVEGSEVRTKPAQHNPFIGTTVSSFDGKTKTYEIVTLRSGNNRNGFLDRDCTALLDTVTDLYFRVYPDRDRVISADRMKHSLSHPRTILTLVKHKDVPVGYGIFPRLNIEIRPRVTESVLYSSRAFLPEHTGGGIGTHVLDEAIRMHREELTRSHRQLRWGALMTQTPLSPLTLEKVPDIENIYPFRERFNTNRDAQVLLLGVHKAVFMHSQGIDTATGVSRGELREIGMNDTWRPRSDQGRVWEIYQEMVSPPPKGLRMNREAGDVVYVLFRLG